MNISAYLKRSCAVLSLLTLLACSGGGGGGGGAAAPASVPDIAMARSIDFEAGLLNSKSGLTFEIKNVGTGSLTIQQITKPAQPFSIPDANDFCSGKTLAPSQACALTVLFSPTDQGPFTDSFNVPSNDPDSGNVTIRLSGEGYGLNVWINSVHTDDCTSFVAEVTVTDPANPDPNSPSNVALRFLNEGHFTVNGGLTITSLSNLYPAPVSVVLALDSSESLDGVMANIKTAAKSFVDLLGPEDEAAVCKFCWTDRIVFYPASAPLFVVTDAGGKQDVNAYIDTAFGDQFTPLYDAIMQSIDRAAQGAANKRKAVIVLSDGVDYTSAVTKTADEVIAWAVLKGIPVFTIYIVDPTYGGGDYGNTDVLKKLARETGGQYYYSDTADLTSVFQQISSVMSNKYTIGYTLSAPACTGTLNVRVDWINGLYGQESRIYP